MQNVVIADDRAAWIRAEDKLMVCWLKCSKYKKCSSHFGMECKHMGGTEIPKIRR